MAGRIVTKLQVALFRKRAIVGLVAHGLTISQARERVGAFGDGSIIQWILAHQDDILAVIKFVAMLISMFAAIADPDIEQSVLATFTSQAEADEPHPLTASALAGFSFGSLLDLVSIGGPVAQAVVKALTAADVGLAKILEYLPLIVDKVTAGVTDVKEIVEFILAKLQPIPAVAA